MRKIVSIATLLLVTQASFSQMDVENFNKGLEAQKNDNYAAIRYFTNAIKYCEPNSAELRSSYYYRGINKFIVSDFYGAIEDVELSFAIEIKTSKICLMIDVETLIEDQQKSGYLMLGDCYIVQNEKKKACLYYSKSGELGEKLAYDRIAKQCR